MNIKLLPNIWYVPKMYVPNIRRPKLSWLGLLLDTYSEINILNLNQTHDENVVRLMK